MKLKAKGKYKFIRHGGKTIQEHQVIGRRLFRRRSNWTMRIHHKNGDKSDNTPDNLELLSTQNHSRLHAGWERIGKNRFVKRCRRCPKIFEEGDTSRKYCHDCKPPRIKFPDETWDELLAIAKCEGLRNEAQLAERIIVQALPRLKRKHGIK